MHSTKTQILQALKRHGRCSVDDLVVSVGVAPMTIRQHLATLERDSLVGSQEERRRLGRPHFVYHLTENGEESFPRRYDRLAMYLLQEVGALEGAELVGLSATEKTALLFDKVADRFIALNYPQLRGLSFAKRVAAVAEILQAEGGFAEWQRTEDGYEIRDYNCFYRRFMGTDGNGGAKDVYGDGACRWHRRVLSELLGVAITAAALGDGRTDRCCRFAVQSESSSESRIAALAASGSRRRT